MQSIQRGLLIAIGFARKHREYNVSRIIWSQAVVVVLGISLSGCKSGPDQAEMLDSMAKPTPGGLSSDGANFSVKQPPSVYVTDRSGAKLPDVTQASATGHVEKLRSAAHSIKGALQIEPNVVAASDPTQLRHNPGPIQPQLFLSAAALCEQQGRLPAAIDQYNRLLELDPNNRSALIGLGRLNHRIGDLDAALDIYTAASKHHPNDPVILNDLGLCLARAGRINESIASLQTAIRLKPNSKLYRNNLAAVMVEANRTQEAIALLQQAHGADVAYYNVAYMLQQRGNVQAAAQHFEQALRINPSFEPARQMLNQLTPQIGTMPTRRTAPQRGFRTGMLVPNPPPVQQNLMPPVQAAPIAPQDGATHQAPVVRAGGSLAGATEAGAIIPASHVEPVAAEAEKEIGVGIRMPMPRRTSPDQGTLLPPSPGEVPSARAVNFLPVAE